MTNFYKYVSPERIDGLLDGKIRFTQPGAFNDPFEIPAYKLIRAIRAETLLGSVTEAGLELMRAAAATGNLAGVSTAMATVGAGHPLGFAMPLSQPPSSSVTSPLLGTSVAQPARLAQRPQMAAELYAPRQLPVNVADEAQKAIELIDETYGILSLTAVEDNLLMWAHYSAAHTGAVIRVNIDDTNFAKDGEEVKQEVEYDDDDELPELPHNLQDVLVKQHFFTKSKEWKYEKEYRIVRYLKNKTEMIDFPKPLYNIYLFDFPPSCIEELIFGVRFDKGEKEKITTRISESPQLKHIKLQQAILSPSHFKLIFQDWSLEKQKQVAEEEKQKQKQVAEEERKESNRRILEAMARLKIESDTKRILEHCCKEATEAINERISEH